MNQKRKLLFLNFAFRNLPDKHRITGENPVECHKRTSPIGKLLGTGCQESRVLVLRLVRKRTTFLGLDLCACHRANLGMLSQALHTERVHYCLFLQKLPSVFQMDGSESPWLDPKAESS